MNNKFRLSLFGVLLFSALIISTSMVPYASARPFKILHTQIDVLPYTNLQKNGSSSAPNYQQGYKDGYQKGLISCHTTADNSKPPNQNPDYQSGYNSGYSDGAAVCNT